MEYFDLIVTIVGFLSTFAALSRKMVTKDDLEKIIARIDTLEKSSTEVEKKIAVIEYRLDNEKGDDK